MVRDVSVASLANLPVHAKAATIVGGTGAMQRVVGLLPENDVIHWTAASPGADLDDLM